MACSQLLLDSGADKDLACQRGKTPVAAATEAGHMGVLRLLLEASASCDPIRNIEGLPTTPLYLAVVKDRPALVDMLLIARADADRVCARGNTPLHVASEKGLLEAASLLLQARASTEP